MSHCALWNLAEKWHHTNTLFTLEAGSGSSCFLKHCKDWVCSAADRSACPLRASNQLFVVRPVQRQTDSRRSAGWPPGVKLYKPPFPPQHVLTSLHTQQHVINSFHHSWTCSAAVTDLTFLRIGHRFLSHDLSATSLPLLPCGMVSHHAGKHTDHFLIACFDIILHSWLCFGAELWVNHLLWMRSSSDLAQRLNIGTSDGTWSC